MRFHWRWANVLSMTCKDLAGGGRVLADDRDLTGLEVLVVTGGDGLDLERMLWMMGCVVLPVASSATEASSLLRSFRPDVALIDVRLERGAVLAFAEELASLGVSFALVTAPGDNWSGAEPVLRDRPRLAEPLPSGDLRRALLQLLGDRPLQERNGAGLNGSARYA
jgi:hypothetical protein